MDREPLDAGRLRSLLQPRWEEVSVVAQTTSTNADLLARAGSAPDRTLLVAEEQVDGRGRLDRTWASPPRAGLLVSMLVRPSAPVAAWGWLPLLTGVALARTVRSLDVAAVLKWPNDLQDPAGGKLAGILVQAASGAAVVGIGLNVSITREELPVDTGSSLALAGAGRVDRTTLLAALATELDEWLIRFDAVTGDAHRCGVYDAYLELCDTVGRSVRVSLGDGSAFEGDAVGVDESGRIVIRTDTGERVVSAGDLQHLRRA